MRFTVLVTLAAQVFIGFAHAQTTGPTSKDTKLKFDGRAAVIEVVPPPWVETSADADALWQRLIAKHAALLQHTHLIREVVRTEIKTSTIREWADRTAEVEDALRVRIVPGTPLIEVLVERDVAGVKAATWAGSLTRQYVENEKAEREQRQQFRREAVRNLLQRYEFRVQELSRIVTDAEGATNAPTTRPDGSTGGLAAATQRTQLAQARNDLRQTQELLDDLRKREEAIHLQEDPDRLEIRIVCEPKPW